MQIETNATAANWMKKIAGDDFEHIVVFRHYPDANTKAHPTLRDREPEMRKMFRHYADVRCITAKGAHLRDAGWELAGAQLVQEFKIIVVK